MQLDLMTHGSGKDALEASIAAVSKYGGAGAGYRTMLDALFPALAVLQEVIINGHIVLHSFS